MTRATALAFSAVIALACEASPTGSISLFPDEAGGSASQGGASNGSGDAKGGASSGGAPYQGGRPGSGGTTATRGGSAGSTARGGGESRCSSTSCTSDTACQAEVLVCNTLLHLCCLCNDDSQCTSPQHCERTEGHCD